jgi:hypothetical protein
MPFHATDVSNEADVECSAGLYRMYAIFLRFYHLMLSIIDAMTQCATAPRPDAVSICLYDHEVVAGGLHLGEFDSAHD